MSNQKTLGKWNVKFIDTISEGQVQTTSITGHYSYNDVVEFFGLKNSDVLWYEIELDPEYNN